MGNTGTLDDTAVLKYTVWGASPSPKLLYSNNYQLVDLVEFKDFSAGQTSVDITISKLSGAYYAGLCSLVIEVSNNFTQDLETPVLTSVATGETEISNTFTAPSNLSEGVVYELQLAHNSDYSDAITIYNGIELQFTVGNLTPGTNYYLRLRAVKAGYTTSTWDPETVLTLGDPPVYIPNTSVLINFSNEYLPQTDDGEWNMAKVPTSLISGGAYQKNGLRSTPELEITGISLYLENFDKSGNSFYAPNPSGSAIYPDFVIISGLMKSDVNSNGLIRLSGLDPNLFYTVYIMGNTTDLGTAVMSYSSGSQLVNKTIGGGNFQGTNLAELKNISNGMTTADIIVHKTSGVFNAGICSMAIEVSNIAKP